MADNHFVGLGTPASRLKTVWRKRMDRSQSLKEFARALLKQKDPDAQEFFANKSGKLEKAAQGRRWDTKGKMILETRLATKSSRKKVKTEKKKPAA